MKQFFIILLSLFTTCINLSAQVSTSLSRYDFFYAGESVRQQMFKVEGGKVTWHFNDPQGRGEISDAVLLSDGHILMAHQHGIKEIQPVEELPNGNILACSNQGLVREFDIRGAVVNHHPVALPTRRPHTAVLRNL